ncbi:MAG: HD domain-containing protein [Deltaproteobacteria bacterium]|nr:HD domain-containing protein [Deltaproteobacteria bacterium]
MNAQALLPSLKAWFQSYTHGFSSDDPIVQENLDLKREHTWRVCEAIRDIGWSLDLSKEDLCLAEASGLLHDIGRFEQYRRYRTFSDYKSENHAALGARIIQAAGILAGLEPVAADIILRAVAYHNRADLPLEEKEPCLFFLKLLRDADKLDIWRVVTEYYRNARFRRNRTIELDLPDVDRVSKPVYEALMQGRLVQTADLKTLNDFKLLQIGWIYDINFPMTFNIIEEKKYLERILDALPRQCPRVTEVYARARAHLERNASAA